MRTGLRLLIVAALLAIVDFRMNAGPDLIPDALGGALALVAVAWNLAGGDRLLDLAVWPAGVAFGASVIGLAAPGGRGGEAVGLLGTAAGSTVAVLVLLAIARIAAEQGAGRLAREAARASRIVLGVTVAGTSLGLVGLLVGDGPTRVEVSGAPAALVAALVAASLALGGWALSITWRASSRLADPWAAAETSPPR